MQPHRIRYWLTPPGDDAHFDARVADICALYRAAPTLAARGERVVCTDELTGVQALERLHPGLPPRPGKVERREFEYIRHGTLSCIVNRDVATGEVVAPSCGPTRTEADFLAHIERTIATAPAATRWHFVVDNLNIHRSASLVCFVAADAGLDLDLGVKGTAGILASQQSRAAFLGDPSHRLVFPLHPQAQLVAQPGRDLAEHPGTQAAPARLVHLARGLAGPRARLHRLLQPDDGQALQVDVSRQGSHRVNRRVISATLY